MSKTIMIIFFVFATVFYGTNSCAADESTRIEYISDMNQQNETFDQDAIMAMCNETFRTPMGLFIFISLMEKHTYILFSRMHYYRISNWTECNGHISWWDRQNFNGNSRVLTQHNTADSQQSTASVCVNV